MNIGPYGGFLLSVLMSHASPAQADEVALILVQDSTVTVKPGSGPTIVNSGKVSASAQVTGNELLVQCVTSEQPKGVAYGRKSSAAGRADVTSPDSSSPTSLSYRLSAFSTTSGGHFRTGECIDKYLVGFSGHDTQAEAAAVATAVVRIRFDGGRPNVPYFLKISRLQSGTPQSDQLTDPDGKVIPLSSPDSPYPVILSKPGQDYFLRTSVAAVARNNGGCCSEQASATTDMTLAIERAPLLFGGRQTGFIVGGVQTEGYKNVAMILLDGLPHCTATLVSESVLVTAAHCVDGHMTKDVLAAGKVTAAFGSVYSQPLLPPIAVARASYPDSGDTVFNPRTLLHDIAVLHLKTPVNFSDIAPSELHSGTPSWQQIKAQKTKLIFVGFGFNMLNNEKVGLGIKREAAWAISGYDDHAVSFATPGTSTCNGDSGGPGFLEGEKSLILVAVTSGGDDVACTYGFDTRIDAYIDWLRLRIAQ